jgi:hypothetical protein
MKKGQKRVVVAEGGRLSAASIFILIGCPLVFSRQYIYGGLAIAVGIIIAVKSSMDSMNEAEKLELRYSIISAEDLIAELEQLDDDNDVLGDQQNAVATETRAAENRLKYLQGLSALAQKYNRSERKQELCTWCQQVAFTVIRLYPEDNEAVAGAISLLALIAQNADVRKRFKYQAEDYGLNKPINVLQNALGRAKLEEDETKEELLAETLRKGCLFLGAVCNDDNDLGLALMIAKEGGLELIVDAASWFRLHEDVSNWALWAVFMLCFDQTRIKIQLVRSRGIQFICELMRHNPSSIEVNRHGIALLFDLLRENQSTEDIKWDPWEIRKVALASGLHEVVFSAMNEFSDSMDIMMMGQEMLVGTGFQGDIPLYQQM